MASRRLRDLKRLLEAEARPFGAVVGLEVTNGCHWRCILTIGDRTAFFFASRTPSDRLSQKKVAADARRTLRGLAEARVMP